MWPKVGFRDHSLSLVLSSTGQHLRQLPWFTEKKGMLTFTVFTDSAEIVKMFCMCALICD